MTAKQKKLCERAARHMAIAAELYNEAGFGPVATEVLNTAAQAESVTRICADAENKTRVR